MKLKVTLVLVLIVVSCSYSLAQDDDPADTLLEDDFDDIKPEAEEGVEEEATELPSVERPTYSRPVERGPAHFVAVFESQDEFDATWVQSKARKQDIEEDLAKYDGKWGIEELTNSPILGDNGLVLKSKAKHHAIASKLRSPFRFDGKPFIVQYEVNFQEGQECGGAYLKLLSGHQVQLEQFYDKTPYTVMFGPDKCGSENKLHFIFRHKNPQTQEYEEKHAKQPKAKKYSHVFSDKKTHVFQLIISNDQSWEIYLDRALIHSGSLLTDMEPPVNPAKEIVDPEDKKPEDWDDREKIADPHAEKPEDWDENEPEQIVDETATMPSGWLEEDRELIPDPDAVRPDDWDDDMDGEWEAPMITNPVCESAPGCGKWEAPMVKNPKYKGKWKVPMIKNVDYQGKWEPRKIDNPDYFEDKNPYSMTPIAAVGLELWSMSPEIFFDNIVVTDDRAMADQFIGETWDVKHEVEEAGSNKGIYQSVMAATHEKPWLWAVILVVVVLPLILIIFYCCCSSSPKTDVTAESKKTDAVTADDLEQEEPRKEEEKGAGDAAGGAKAPAPKQSKKSKLDEPAATNNHEGDNEESAGEEEEDESTADKPTKSSPRKRRPQKEQ